MSTPTVSVVINTFNRADVLERALEGLRWVAYDAPFEVVVVNGPSTDGTADLLERWAGRVKVGSCPARNLSQSRNIGIAMSAGDIVAFIDDDAVPEAEWLTQLTPPYEDAEVAVVGGHTYDHTGVDFQYRYGTIDRFGVNARPRGTWDTSGLVFPQAWRFPYPIGTNSSFRRSTLIAAGGFDEEYEYFLDETDVVVRLIDSGFMVRQVPRAFVHHKFAPSAMRGENRVATSRYSVVKNHVYFGLRHARRHRSLEQINAEAEQFVASERVSVVNAVKAGLLGTEDLARYDEESARALVAGREAASREPRLLGPELLAQHASRLLPFETVTGPPVRRAIVTATEPIVGAPRDELVSLAEAGWVIHVLQPGATVHTVDFRDGLWVHALADERREGLTYAELVAAETARLRADRAVTLETDVSQAASAMRDAA